MAELLFGEFELDTRRLVARGPDGPVELRAKARELLFYLIANRDRFVSRAELGRAVWGGEVSAASLNQTVSELRLALGDSPRTQRYIETRFKAGYRFVAEVVHRPTETLVAARPSPPRRRPIRTWALGGLGVATVLGLTTVVWEWRTGERSLLVPPPIAEDRSEPTLRLAEHLGTELERLAVPAGTRRAAPGTTPDLTLDIRCRTVHGLRVEVVAALLSDASPVWKWTWVGPADGESADSLPARTREEVERALQSRPRGR